jgi:hypothetical protein
LYIRDILACHYVEQDDQASKPEAGQAPYDGPASNIGLRVRSEEGLRAGEKSADGFHCRQEACRKRGSVEDDAGEGKDLRHALSVADPDARMARYPQILCIEMVPKRRQSAV